MIFLESSIFRAGRTIRRRSCVLGLAVAFAGGLKATALEIIPSFVPNSSTNISITNLPAADKIVTTINAAIFEYKYRIADPIPVHITFKYDTSISLGQSSTQRPTNSYATYRAALASHAVTVLDNQAVASLPVQTNNPVNGSTNLIIQYPLQRALGINTNIHFDEQGMRWDGTILLNTPKCKLSPSDPFPLFGYSLYMVICHEIDEVLGTPSSIGIGKAPAPSDLFRYDQNNSRTWTTGDVTAYLSVPNHGRVRKFNQDATGDYADWADLGVRVQDAFATELAIQPLLDEEMKFLDIIGYTTLPKPVWLDLGEGPFGNGDYFWAYNSESAAGANVGTGGAIMIKGSPTLHHSRLDASTYGRPVKLTSFNGTTRIVP